MAPPCAGGGGGAIPRILFTFWDAEPPELVKCCIALMRQRNPRWEVRQLTYGCAGLPTPPTPRATLSGAQQADWYRLHALAEHGGVYLDATCVTLGPIEEWVDVGRAAVQGFEYDCDGATLESWAIAAPRGSALVAAWRDEFARAVSLGHDARGLLGPYCERLPAGVVTPRLRDSLPYLAIHAAWRVARRSRAAADEEVVLLPALEVGRPYRYLALHSWDSASAVADLFAAPSAEESAALAATPLLKLRGKERQHVRRLAEYGRRSWLARSLLGATVPETMAERLAWIACGLEPP